MNTSTEVEWLNTAIIPFGKYRGQPISILYGDPACTHFLLTLKWFRNIGSNPEATIVELCAENERQSWLRESEQGAKWSFCLTAVKIDPRIRRDDE
jgi:hypothetical protein